MAEVSIFVRRREPVAGTSVGYTAPKISRDLPVEFGQVGKGPQGAPDPIRYGDFRGRIPKENVLHFEAVPPFQVDSFVLRRIQPSPIARVPAGRQMPHGYRYNTRVPPTVSFGSQFEFAGDDE